MFCFLVILRCDFWISVEKTAALTSIASACESGHDFSSRWFTFDSEGQPGTLKSIRTRNIAPVDLNVILGLNENILATLFKGLGKPHCRH